MDPVTSTDVVTGLIAGFAGIVIAVAVLAFWRRVQP